MTKYSIVLMENISLIEGIGFNSGFINPLFDHDEQISRLICYTELNNEECENCELLMSNEIIEQNLKIDIFPNPNSGFLKIRSNKQIIGYDIINELGLTFYSDYNLNNKDLRVNTNLSNGIYFIKIITIDKKIYFDKIIIKK